MLDGNSSTESHWMWGDRMLWSFITLFLLGSVARVCVSREPFDLRRFIGESIFMIIGAIMMYSAGLMQGMNEVQMIGFGALSSLGGIRTFEWILSIAEQVKRSGVMGAK